jgi:hypothetical protein
MPKKIQGCSMAHLVSVPLPNHGTTYTVISHQFVIDYSKTALQNAGFIIIDEEYRCTADGNIAQGIYRLNYNSDPELSMMFAWTNSYNKQVRFKCGVGAYVNKTGTVMVCGDIGSWARKHTGTADTETQDTIDDQVSNAHMYYNQLVADKAHMEGINMNKRKQAQMLGILFAEYQILTTEQASMVRQQMDRPIHVFLNADSMWAFYNYVTVALQHSHPKTWMEDQRILHHFISEVNKFAPVSQPVPVVSEPADPLYEVPNQTNILDQIEELQKAQYPVTLDDAFIKEADEFSMAQLAGVKAPEDVVQEGSDFDIDLHQSEEIIEDVIEAEEVPFDIDGDDDVVQYTDPVGNVFEVPDLKIDIVDLNETTKAAILVQEEHLSLEPTPEDYEQFESDEVNLWDDEPSEASLIEPAQEDSFQVDGVNFTNDINEEPMSANLNVIEVEDDNAFDLDFTDDLKTDDSDVDFEF